MIAAVPSIKDRARGRWRFSAAKFADKCGVIFGIGAASVRVCFFSDSFKCGGTKKEEREDVCLHSQNVTEEASLRWWHTKEKTQPCVAAAVVCEMMGVCVEEKNEI